MRYNLTLSQRLELIPLAILWIFADRKRRAKWDDLKSGMEKHQHNFTVPNEEISNDQMKVMKCSHRGCNKNEVLIKYKRRFYE